MVSSLITFFAYVRWTVDAHGGMMLPHSWENAGRMVPINGGQVGKAGCSGNSAPKTSYRPYPQLLSTENCHGEWYENNTWLPDGITPFIKNEPAYEKYLTYPWASGSTPWMAPGKGLISNPCGYDGGNKNGCLDGTWRNQGPCAIGGYGQGPDARTFPFPDVPETEWAQGSIQDVAWGILANHGGGYAYRLCKLPDDGKAALTENCFQDGHLEFADQIHRFKRNDTFLQTTADAVDFDRNYYARLNNEPEEPNATFGGITSVSKVWRRSPVPGCISYPPKGSTQDSCATHFAPLVPDLFGFGPWGPNKLKEFLIFDKVKVPAALPTGKYVLSFRWDVQQTSQVWLTCADILIVPQTTTTGQTGGGETTTTGQTGTTSTVPLPEPEPDPEVTTTTTTTTTTTQETTGDPCAHLGEELCVYECFQRMCPRGFRYNPDNTMERDGTRRCGDVFVKDSTAFDGVKNGQIRKGICGQYLYHTRECCEEVDLGLIDEHVHRNTKFSGHMKGNLKQAVVEPDGEISLSAH